MSKEAKGQSDKPAKRGGKKKSVAKATAKRPGKKGKGSDLHPSVIISGYYGFDNLGDELILQVLVDELKREGLTITVLSQDPQKTAARYGVKALHRNNLIDIIDALAQANLFISGGGGLFQDATGPMSSIYYGGLIHLAHYFEVPVCFWGQGVGPLTSSLARSLTASALKKCECITVRDDKSADLVEELMGTRPEVTADPVWLLRLPKKKKKPARQKKDTWTVGVSLRPWPDLTPERLAAFADFLARLVADSRKQVDFLLLPFQAREDTPLLQELAARLEKTQAGQCTLVAPDEVIAAVGQCDILFGMRFHSLVLGLLQDVAVYGLSYDPKVENLLARFGLEGTPVHHLERIQAETVQEYFNHRYPAVDLGPLIAKARRNFDILDEYMHMPEAELVI